MESDEFDIVLQQLWRKINYKMGQSMYKFFQPLKLSPMQGIILMRLNQEKKPIMITELSEKLHTPNSNISNICARLEESGYIEKVRSREDLRKVHIQLTEMGKKIVVDIDRMHREAMSNLHSHLNGSDKEMIIIGLTKLSESFGGLEQDLDL